MPVKEEETTNNQIHMKEVSLWYCYDENMCWNIDIFYQYKVVDYWKFSCLEDKLLSAFGTALGCELGEASLKCLLCQLLRRDFQVAGVSN